MHNSFEMEMKAAFLALCLLNAGMVLCQPGTCPDAVDSIGPNPPIGRYVPQCTEDGLYKKLQCHGSTGYCWCVDQDGQEVEGTKRGPGEERYDCEKGSCDNSVENPPPGQFVPQCTADGHFEKEQCWGSTGHCWCVDHYGREIDATKRGHGEERFNCENGCSVKLHKLMKESPPGIAGRYFPQCDDMGEYIPKQFNPSSGYIWCVDKEGNEIPGTSRAPGMGDITCTKENMGNGATGMMTTTWFTWMAAMILVTTMIRFKA